MPTEKSPTDFFDLRSISAIPIGRLAAVAVRLAAAQALVASRMMAEREDEPAVEPVLVSAPETARRLNVNESWVRSEARKGRIPCVRIGRYRRFYPAAVVASISARRHVE